jgi:uncharacterized membrane protein
LNETLDEEENAMRDRSLKSAVTIVVSMLAANAALASGTAAPRSQQLIYAVYSTETAADGVLSALRSAEDQKQIRLNSYAELTKGQDGKVRIKDQRRGTGRATVGGIAGMLEGAPGSPSAAATGAEPGYLTARSTGLPAETLERITLLAGESAIVAVVDDQWAAEVQRLQQAEATRIVTHPVPAPRPTTGKEPLPSP